MSAQSSAREILLGDRTVSYTLTRKQVKNLNLRIHADGTIAVSAHPCVPLSSVEVFLRAKAAFVLRALDRFAVRAQSTPSLCQYEDGEMLIVLGEAKRLCVTADAVESVVISDGQMILTLPDPFDRARREKLVEEQIKVHFRSAVEELCRRHYPKIEACGIPFPEIRFRRMKTRWGSCHPTKGIMTFNDALASAPLTCIEYVVLHELTHFLHPDHSPAFHARLVGFLPDAAQRREALKNVVPYLPKKGEYHA